MTVSDILLKILTAHGVRNIFGIAGDAINDVIDAIRRQEDISFIGVRHEEAGAFAASAEAKLTGCLSVCMGTAGPGAVHLLNGLYDAKLDHAPVLAITGQVATGFIGTQYHQEIDLERLFSDVAVYSQTVTTEEQVPAVLLEACRAAVAERGVAHISIPTNVSGRHVSFDPDCDLEPPAKGRILPREADCEAAGRLMNESNRVVVFAGIGCAQGRDELVAFAEAARAPIVRSLKAKEVIDDRHPLCIGGLGMLGGHPAVKAMNECDLLVMVGTDFPYREFYPEKASVIQIDIEPTRIGKRHPVDVGIVGEAGPTLSKLASHVRGDRSGAFLGAMQDEMKAWLKRQEKVEQSNDVPIRGPRVMRALCNVAPERAIFTCDTGTTTAWSARHLYLKAGQRYTLSGSLASMAYGLPAALGAQLAYPDRRVFALVGDGAFTMLMGDFVTAVKYKLPIIVLVFDNSKLAFISLEQEAKGLPEWGIDLTNPDFAAFARACGGYGATIEHPDALEDAIKEALRQQVPAVLDIKVDPDELIMPPEISLSQAVHFGMAKIREAFHT